ncbi:fumarylacetoacetase, partial [Aquabacterium sp.]|uniref:fumarylacetoacetase n=1 Tax=Aquabacterium sp. TaxID=1872578 RepID=UPI002CCEB444
MSTPPTTDITTGIAATNDPALTSWVATANAADSDFPLQNLPYGRFRRQGSGEPWRIGVAIGDQVLDLRAALATGLWLDEISDLLRPLAEGDLNSVMAETPAQRSRLRQALSQALRAGSPLQEALQPCLVAQAAVEMAVPCRIGDYTDFYTGIHHATAVGKLFRPDNPLLPNYKWVPIGYHGRSSSIGVSGQRFRRPVGQTMAPGAEVPTVAPSRRLDYELELAVFVGTPNPQGEAVTMDQAEDHVFGLGLFNDWSARDIQAWEYQPLGPFLSKSFASTLSPWIVTLDALQPFRAPFVRPAGDPQPLPYLDSAANRSGGAIEIQLEVLLQTQAMREAGLPAHRLSQSNFTDAYWT